MGLPFRSLKGSPKGFAGKWLRRHFRDEELAATKQQGALRVADIPEDLRGFSMRRPCEDEDMLNVAAWEDKACS